MSTPQSSARLVLVHGDEAYLVDRSAQEWRDRATADGEDVEVLERTDDVGGNWNYGSPASRVFATTHLVSSKRMTEYPDFPMPAHYPDFPSHVQAQEYLRAILYPVITADRDHLSPGEDRRIFAFLDVLRDELEALGKWAGK